MCKNETLYRLIVREYHPDISKTTAVQTFMDDHWHLLNIERCIEESMAAVGGYKFVDGKHHDFVHVDNSVSECKTASVFPGVSSRTAQNSHPLEITNIVSRAGHVKQGLIRVVLYNPHKEQKNALDFFAIPSADIDNVLSVRYTVSGVGTIRATWNRITDKIARLETYRVKDFVTLAKLTEAPAPKVTKLSDELSARKNLICRIQYLKRGIAEWEGTGALFHINNMKNQLIELEAELEAAA